MKKRIKRKIRWNLFGEIVHEKIDMNDLPKYMPKEIPDNLEELFEHCGTRCDKCVDMDEEIQPVTTDQLLREAFYVYTLYKWDNEGKLNDNEQDNFYAKYSDNIAVRNLKSVDELNAFLMRAYKILFYYMWHQIEKIRGFEQDKDQENLQKVLCGVDQVLSKDGYNKENIERSVVNIENENMKNFAREICTAINQAGDGDQIEVKDRVERIIGKWIFSASSEGDSVCERKIKLLREMHVVWEAMFACGYHMLMPKDLLHILIGFLENESCIGMITVFLDMVNNAVVYIQNRICNLSLMGRPDFNHDTCVGNLKSWLKRFDALRNYVDGGGCFALLKNCSKGVAGYFAISGMDYKNVTETACEEVAKIMRTKGMQRVSLWNQKVPSRIYYYLNEHEYISYEDYMHQYGVAKDEYGRMFSCCERKLFSKIEKGKEYKLYVRYSPCEICLDAIKHVRKTNKIKVCYGEKWNKGVKKRNEFDKRARCVLTLKLGSQGRTQL